MPKVSVIVPVYNVEKYLDRCITSVLTQTIKDIECILIDDGSMDKSPCICDNYAIKDNRIRVIHQKNAGVSVARNVGLNLANGEWVLFVDSDDEIELNTIEVCLNSVQENTDLVQFGFYSIVNNQIKKTYLPLNYSPDSLVDNFTFATRFVKKSFLIKNNISFPERISFAEDWYFNYFLYVKNPNTVYLNQSFYKYYQNEESVMHNLTMKNIQDELFVINKVSLLKEKNEKLLIQRKIQAKHHIIRSTCDLDLYRKTFSEVNKNFFKESSIKMKIIIILINLHFDKIVKILNRY